METAEIRRRWLSFFESKGHTVVPLELYFIRGRAKVLIALARGKQEYDKRQTLRQRQDDMEARRAMSLRNHGDRR